MSLRGRRLLCGDGNIAIEVVPGVEADGLEMMRVALFTLDGDLSFES